MANQQPAAPEPPVTAIVPTQFELTIDQLEAQVKKVQAVIERVMVEGQHYGLIPGTKKKSLYKAGSELLCTIFRFAPTFTYEMTREGDHREVIARCSLVHIPTGMKVGEGLGSCSTREKKYAYRRAERACPECKKPTIKRSRYANRDAGDKGWYCHKKAGGCGAEFVSGDRRITEQPELGDIPNPELPDAYNTVLKMALKRALAAAVLTATAASDIFTQDLEERNDPAVRDQHDDTDDRGGWDDEPSVEDPDPFFDRIKNATTIPELGRIGTEMRTVRFSPQDTEDLRVRYGDKLKQLKAQSTQGSTLDDVAARQQR